MESTRRILIVEDDRPTQELLARHLVPLGYQVDLASDGNAGLLLWARSDYDLVLTDVGIPGMNGLQLIARIRASGRPKAQSVPLVAMTGSAEPAGSHPDAAGVTTFLSKPFSATDLQDLLDRCLTASDDRRECRGTSRRALPGVAEAVGHPAAEHPPGDAEIMLAIARTFIETIPGYLQEIGTACALGNRPAITDAVHKLKSAARLVGGVDVAALCEQVESADPGLEADALVRLTAGIPDAIAALEQRLTSILAAKQAPAG